MGVTGGKCHVGVTGGKCHVGVTGGKTLFFFNFLANHLANVLCVIFACYSLCNTSFKGSIIPGEYS